MSYSQPQTIRTVISGVDAGGATTKVSVGEGVITRVHATIEATQDADATPGTTGASDIDVTISDSLGHVLLDYPLDPTDPYLTIIAPEWCPVGRGTGSLTIDVATDVGATGDGVIVVTLTLE